MNKQTTRDQYNENLRCRLLDLFLVIFMYNQKWRNLVKFSFVFSETQMEPQQKTESCPPFFFTCCLLLNQYVCFVI